MNNHRIPTMINAFLSVPRNVLCLIGFVFGYYLSSTGLDWAYNYSMSRLISFPMVMIGTSLQMGVIFFLAFVQVTKPIDPKNKKVKKNNNRFWPW